MLLYRYRDVFDVVAKLDKSEQKKLLVEYSARTHMFINMLHDFGRFYCSQPIFTFFII